MIRTLLRIGWLNLARDRVAQLMVFVLPISFFSIFAMIFGNARSGTSRVPVVVVDEDRTAASRGLVRALAREGGLRLVTTTRASGAPKSAPEVPVDRARAEQMVRGGDYSVALVIPAGFDSSLARFDGRGRPVLLLTDPSDPIAPQMVSGLLQQAAMTAAPDAMARNGVRMFDRYAGGLTALQRQRVESWLQLLRSRASADSAGRERGDTTALRAPGSDRAFSGLVAVEERKIAGQKRGGLMISYYAAGIAVMFLLFSASSAGGSLLEELESGTLDRVLTSRVRMTGLLAGKWLSLTRLGVLQITVMFLWAMIAFRLDLLHHLPGFALMTIATAATAAGFGLVLATACRTRQQLGGISTIVILTVSALGGSMFPRFLMSESLQRIGRVSFNAWALDGYIKVFWRDAPVGQLVPELAVLAAWSLALAILARLLARRWETA